MRRSLLILVLLSGCVIDAPTFYEPDGGGDDVDVDAQTTVTLTITRSGDSAGTVTAPEGIDCGDDCMLTVPNGTTVTLTATPDANTVFTGWTTGGCTGIEPCELTLTADTTVDAAFDRSRVTVTVAPGGNGAGTVTSDPTGVACGATCVAEFGFGSSVTLTAAPTSGSTFVGWTGGTCTGTDPCTFDATTDVEIQASFALDNSVIVTLDGNGEGRVTSDPVGIDCGDDCDEAYAPGTTVTLTAAVIGDSTFDGWNGGGCSGTSTCVVSSDDAVLVTATFILNQHTLGVATNGTGSGTVTSNPGGIACPGDCTEAYDSGTTVTLTATPIAGKFAGWSGDCNGTGACAPVLGVDRDVTATFTLITVGNVSSPTTNGIYSDPTTIPIEITFSETVVVTGTPTLALNTGGVATYGGGSFTNKLTFNYVVAAGHATADLDYASAAALSLNGGAIEDALGNDATLTLPAPAAPNSLGATKAIVIDAVLPVVSAISGPPQYENSTAATLTWSVTEVHPGTTSCTFTTGTGTIGTCNTTGATVTGLNQGAHTLRVTHTDTAGNVSAARTYDWVVDTIAPTVTGVGAGATTASGSYGAGTSIDIVVSFSESVTVAGGPPVIALSTGGTASYLSGSGTSSLTFRYTVAVGHNTGDLDYTGTTALSLGGGTIRDVATNNATLTLTTPGAAGSLGANRNLVIDTTAPTVTGVGAGATTASGSYGAGTSIDIVVTFSENVTVAGGPPMLALNTGGTASYLSGSATTSLTFRYTVAAGHNTGDLDYTATTALSLGGGTIRDAVLNDATLTLVAPGAAGSLGVNRNLVIDTAGPVVTITTPTSAETFAALASTTALGGTASDPAGIASVSWANATNATSGAATGTTTWSVPSVTLAPGANTIVVTATDGLGNTATDTITVTRNMIVAMVAGGNHTCALLDNPSVKCWGNNSSGQLGLGDTANRGDATGEMGDALPMVALGTGRTAVALTAGTAHTCALLDNGSVKCWGHNVFGQLGLGDTASRGDAAGEMGDALPVVALGTGRTAVALAAGSFHTCARLDNATVKCWGDNAEGQLGLGDTANRGDAANEMGDALPAVALGTGRTVVSLVLGAYHTCARLDDSSVKCWGRNLEGQLGLGDTPNRGDAVGEMGDALPAVALGTGRTTIAVAPGGYHVCALLDNARVKCWGRNTSGQLGLGDAANRGDAAGEMGDALPAVDL